MMILIKIIHMVIKRMMMVVIQYDQINGDDVGRGGEGWIEIRN